MSWDATLSDDRGHIDGDWNFTHNTNQMANAIVHPDENTGIDTMHEVLFPKADGREWKSWWEILNGMDGPTSRTYLSKIIDGLEADPPRFQAMNPPNGWGSYDTFLEVLKEMRDRIPEWPCTWRVSG
ncbi:hypothetical protein NONO_c60230 [Nocardia nova SH22a]|uniref:Uncharacterized protein n=1 Tax=Nocardia nova SH22a TaxID=1415166 RepID=W5TNQ8_9NOCA|nr:hypothetical protein [Nocardia nova]AHH20799.1 hypothetical protein NONO_c60230 [Nocardia nova SH22a]